MRKTRVDSGLQRTFIQALIASDAFLAGAAAHLDTSLIESPHLRMIADWCIKYHEAHHQAPRRAIEPIYYTWSEKQEEQTDEDDAIRTLLGGLSEDYAAAGDINVPYLLDELAVYITQRKLHGLRDDLETQLFQGDVEEAILSVNGFRASTIGRGAGIDPLGDSEAWTMAFTEDSEPLIQLPGAAGKFFGTSLARESLIAIQAPEKRGKTWWCIELVLRALHQRRKVAFFQVGDLSEGQILRRLAVRLSARPMWHRDCGEYSLPRAIERVQDKNGDFTMEVIRRPAKIHAASINQEAAVEAVKKFHRSCGTNPDTTQLMLSVHSTGSTRVADIESILTGWEVERGFIPDVVVIDYADILAPQTTRLDVRDQVNETWAAMRRLSQDRRCLVISPTQANAASYNGKTQSMANFSNDKRKMAHVTGMFGLNQNETEKGQGLMRLNWIVLRESPFIASECLFVAQELALGRPMCCSWMKSFKG